MRTEQNVVADFMSRIHNPFEFHLIASCLGIGIVEKNLALVNLWRLPFAHDSLDGHQRKDEECLDLVKE